jgi:hypothetical protein
MDLSRDHTEVDFAVVFAVELAMNINVEDGFALVFECPVLEGLVEGVFVEHFGEKVVGVEFLLIEGGGFAPDAEAVFAGEVGELAGNKRSVELPEMDAFFLVELWSTADEFFAVRGGEEDGAVDVAEVAFFEVVLFGVGLLHV